MMISTAKGFERYRRGLHKNESICLIIRLESMLVLPDQRTELFTLNQGFNTIASESVTLTWIKWKEDITMGKIAETRRMIAMDTRVLRAV